MYVADSLRGAAASLPLWGRWQPEGLTEEVCGTQYILPEDFGEFVLRQRYPRRLHLIRPPAGHLLLKEKALGREMIV